LHLGKTKHRDERPLAAAMGIGKAGSEPGQIARAGRARGLEIEHVEGMPFAALLAHVKAKRPVIVLFQAWGRKNSQLDYHNEYAHGHYAAVIGTDADNVYFADPELGRARGFLSRAEFQARWHGLDYGRPVENVALVVYPDGPPAVEESTATFRPIL
jgi:predicted double-glycine peptidase